MGVVLFVAFDDCVAGEGAEFEGFPPFGGGTYLAYIVSRFKISTPGPSRNGGLPFPKFWMDLDLIEVLPGYTAKIIWTL